MADETDNVYGHYLRWFHGDIFWEILSLTDVKNRGSRQDASPAFSRYHVYIVQSSRNSCRLKPGNECYVYTKGEGCIRTQMKTLLFLKWVWKLSHACEFSEILHIFFFTNYINRGQTENQTTIVETLKKENKKELHLKHNDLMTC